MKSAALALVAQSTCVLAAVWAVTDTRWLDGPLVLMVAVGASRAGLWMFDLAERQIVQQATLDNNLDAQRVLLFNW